jgi:hypothetical protein
MKSQKVILLVCYFLLIGIYANAQIGTCDSPIVPDDLNNGKVTLNLDELCSSCGPYGGSNGTIDNPPNGATGCGIIKFRQADLINCVTITIDPQSTEKTDYYLNPLLTANQCFSPDGSTSSQGEEFVFNIDDITFNGGFFDLLVCSQSTGNRSYNINLGCCPRAGTGRDTSICFNSPNLIDLYTLLTDADPGGTWERLSGTGGDFNALNGTFTSLNGGTTSQFEYTALVDPQNPSCNFTSLVTVFVTPAPQAGNDNTIVLCDNNNPTDLYSLLGQSAETSGIWSGPSILTNGHLGTINPQTDGEGTYLYVIVGTDGCENDTAEIMVTIEESVSAGTNGTLGFCNIQQPGRPLQDGLGGMPDNGGSWSPPTTVPGFFDPQLDVPGTYTYTVTGISPCQNSSAEVVVSISNTLNPGENGSVSMCDNSPPFNLIDHLNGVPDGGGTWSPELESMTGVFNPLVDLPGVYTYSFDQPGCPDASATVTVTINSPRTGGNNADLMVCSLGESIDLYDYIGDPGMDGFWSGPSILINGHQGTFDPGNNSEGIYFYTIESPVPCSDLVLSVNVQLTERPYAGRDTTVTACISENAIDLFALLGTGVTKGGTWSPELQSLTDMFMPGLDGSGTFTYVIEAKDGCELQSASVTTQVIEGFHAGQSAVITLSNTDPPVDLFTLLTMNPDPGGHWDPAPQSGNGILDPTVDLPGTYKYHVPGNGPCLPDSASVIVNILDPLGIPTMGTWGIIILALLLLIVSRIAITDPKNSKMLLK